MYRDGVLKSIWQSEIVVQQNIGFKNKVWDVVIAGAGITGFSCAVELQSRGMKCLLLEAENAGFGTTGGTTAHLNTFFDATYDEVIRNFGTDNARKLAESGREAMEMIRSNVIKYGIDCKFEERTAYLFATDESQEKVLNDLVEASNQVGVEMVYTDTIPFPIPFVRAVRIEGQGQFHPVRYINGLKDAFVQMGGEYLEKCRVEDYEKKENRLVIKTSFGEIEAGHLIYATHTPPGVNLIHFRNIPWRSYVLGIELNDFSYPQFLGYDLNDPYHYYRSQEIDGKNYLIVGGKDHKTGSTPNTRKSLQELENHVRLHFNVKNIAFAWSSQFYEPADGLPYIGRIPGGPDEVMVATGYNGNGMIFGTISGKVLADLILNGESYYGELFNPRRVKPIAGFSKFASHNLNVAAKWITDKVSKEHLANLASLDFDEGKVVSYEGNSYAIYKDPSGEIHALKNLCPHAYCSVEWNNAELTWDCPCHGSRFGVQGNVLNAPAVKGLEMIVLTDENQRKNIL